LDKERGKKGGQLSGGIMGAGANVLKGGGEALGVT